MWWYVVGFFVKLSPTLVTCAEFPQGGACSLRRCTFVTHFFHGLTYVRLITRWCFSIGTLCTGYEYGTKGWTVKQQLYKLILILTILTAVLLVAVYGWYCCKPHRRRHAPAVRVTKLQTAQNWQPWTTTGNWQGTRCLRQGDVGAELGLEWVRHIVNILRH